MAIFEDPDLILSITCLIANTGILAALYILLPKTEKTSYVRYVLRFAIIWALGASGARWAAAQGSEFGIIRLVSEIVLLIGMVPISALWVHLGWQSSLELKAHDGKKAIMRIQLAVYVVAAIFVAIFILLRDGNDLTTEEGTMFFQFWFLGCLGWSIYSFMGHGYDDGPRLERRSRQMLASGTMVMFMLVLIDVLQVLSLRTQTDLATGLNFGAMALLGWGFISKSKFIVPPSDTISAPKDRRHVASGITLVPGKVYFDLDHPQSATMDVLRAQIRRGRPVLVITNKDPERYHKAPRMANVPIVRFVSKDWDDPKGLDTTSEDELDMVPVMAKEFALESWERDLAPAKDTGSVVILDGIHVLARIAGRQRTKELAKELRKIVKGSDQLRLVLIGDKIALGSMAKIFTKAGKNLKLT